MAVFARGYRAYEGTLRGRPPAWTIFREAYRTAFRTVAMRRLRTMTLVIFAGFAIFLYAAINLGEMLPKRGAAIDEGRYSWDTMRGTAWGFYVAVMFLQALLAILAAAGLVSDDLRTRALPLYLVRPLRPLDYAIGKALLLPAILFWITFAPGLLFLLLTSLWQPPGRTWSFFFEHADFLRACGHHFLVSSAAYTGLTLLVSSQTSRRGTTAGITAAAIFGGTMLQMIGRRVQGPVGELLRVLGIPMDTLVEIFGVTFRDKPWLPRAQRGLPETDHAVAFALVLLVVGFFAAWRRARSVEVAS